MRVAAKINSLLSLGASHALYYKNGTWYHRLKRFPAVLIDARGYVLFQTEDQYQSTPGLSINFETDQVHITSGIGSLAGYQSFSDADLTLLESSHIFDSLSKGDETVDIENPTSPSGKSINVVEPYEVAYWCQVFNCTPEELNEAVQEVGLLAGDVRDYLAEKTASLDADTQLVKIKSREVALYEETEDEPEEIDFSEYDITAAPNDFNTKTLFDFISSGIVKIPGFQRNYVWDIKRASKLIESLIIGLPIPQIFLYQAAKNRFIVIDGQQRYMTIYYFMKRRFPRNDKRVELRKLFDTHKGEIPKEILADKEYFTDFDLNLVSKLPNQHNKYNKKNYDTLDEESRTSFDLRTIRNVIIKQNSPDDSNSAVYEIFNRLNSGGVNLKPQEIRTSLYHSEYYDMLYDVNTEPTWRKFTPQPTPDLNMKDIEILLRGFAMLESRNSYTPSMTRFLNSYSEKAKKKQAPVLLYLKDLFLAFIRTCSSFEAKIFFSDNNRFNISLYESVFVATCYKCFKLGTLGVHPIDEASVNRLKQDKDFLDASRFDTASTSNVKKRLERAVTILNPEIES